jgi:hypothetical protein
VFKEGRAWKLVIVFLVYIYIFGYNRGDLSYDEKCVARVTAFHNEFATLASGFAATLQEEFCANIDCASIVLRFGSMVRR